MLRVNRILFKTECFNYKKQRVVNVPRHIVYNTVIDIPQYSLFLPWCNRSHWLNNGSCTVDSSIKGQNEALLDIKFGLFHESYVSRVSYEPFNQIEAVAANNSLFEKLDTLWKLDEIDQYKTLVDFEISLKFHNCVYQRLMKSFKYTITNAMLHHFIVECENRYTALECNRTLIKTA
ncbi:bifunctional START-like domain superfamily/Coenzyme Q-binding protein COQ10 [Babesia duncani]|uniref:Bifunctional START-like domain superfamily/Coenzyme Q-binding protein COQ10 n=1 Tax=Babesia duncani TaxID=323732 RepID=A0AAD9PHA9_9APIC|nr:bifunctional START-like domain superfamily/Coenzyme Q-binding protein COQ10 [Babesia duncani]KAK2195843.1 bifunctional START-like domain superfamily/Coenzyme Q-binding protein COQ10 [Babesia duncani]